MAGRLKTSVHKRRPDPSAPPENASFRTLSDLVRDHAQRAGDAAALLQDDATWSYTQLDTMMDRVAASLQRDGLGRGDVIAVCSHPSPIFMAVFLGALRAGIAVAPLSLSVTPEIFGAMLTDAGASHVFVDDAAATAFDGGWGTARPITLDAATGEGDLSAWLMPEGSEPGPVTVGPEDPFNIIYSSGTTGTPKGIVQSHGMRWSHVIRSAKYGFGPDSVTLLATPLYSNTTLVTLFPTIALGGSVVLMARFDAGRYLELAQRHRMTHTMLVPVQYQRIMATPRFEGHDLTSTRFKFCTSAPFGADLKADVLKRWPGGLVEFYGMTEGGGTCILEAHDRPDKLHTVGRPATGHDIRLIDEADQQLPADDPDSIGEVVGHSAGMMIGYRNQPGLTREAEWFDDSGKRFIRTGDIGRFDRDGFLTLLDRKKDMVISGGFNVYPSDLESVLGHHAAVVDVAVVGVPSRQWGETPIAFVVRHPEAQIHESELLKWANAQLGKTQRLSRLDFVDALPRSAIGKVLKRELRDRHIAKGLEPF